MEVYLKMLNTHIIILSGVLDEIVKKVMIV